MTCLYYTYKNLKCKNKGHYHNLCLIHFRIMYNKFVYKIQSVWRSYRTRRKIKNIYIKLPQELKYIVLHYMTLNHRTQYTINKIYKNKITVELEYLKKLYFEYSTYQIEEYEFYFKNKLKSMDRIKYLKTQLLRI